MSSNALRIIAAVTVLLAVILAVVGYRISRQFAENAEKAAQAQAAPQTLAVIALKPLAAYQPIPRDAIVLAPVAVPPTSEYFNNVDLVAGQIPLTDIDTGAPVTKRYFSEGNALARIIPVGHQALALEINEVIATGGFLRPGDVVDVLVYLRGGGGVEQPQARILLPGARVLAYEERIIDRPQGLKEEQGGPDQSRRRVRTAVLAVPEKDTTRVMLGASLGEIRLSLRPQALQAVEGAAELPPDPNAPVADVAVQYKTITAAELARMGQPPAQKKTESAPRVTIYRGSQTESVNQ
ncbi:MAG: Flp pilus assembly protein CpaB [Pseudomonadota bacterium]|mgnify:CR=1 FL=1